MVRLLSYLLPSRQQLPLGLLLAPAEGVRQSPKDPLKGDVRCAHFFFPLRSKNQQKVNEDLMNICRITVVGFEMF